MSRRALFAVAAVLVVAGIFAMSSLFIVDQTEQALVLQFGQPRRVIHNPGLKLKQPFIQNVIVYDKRLLDFEPPPEEVIASDQKRLVVDTYARYRIINPLLFYQTVVTEAGVRARLGALVSGSLRQVIGNVTLSALLSPERAKIMRQIRDEVAGQAKPFRIDVVDVRIRRADLPAENSEAIYARMQLRAPAAGGAIPRRRCGGGADRPRQRRPRAHRDPRRRPAQRPEAARRRATRRPSRSTPRLTTRIRTSFPSTARCRLIAMRFGGSNTSFVLNPDSSFFRYFESPSGTAAPTGTAGPTPAPAASAPAAKPGSR